MLEFNFEYGDIGYELCKDLRNELFGKVLTDDKEGASFHFVGYDKLEQIAVARLTKISDECYEIAYVAMKPAYRRQYVGDLIMKALADKAERLGATKTVVDAPCDLIPFFEYENYKKIGTEFLKDDILCVKMVKDLTVKTGCGGCKK